MPIKPVELTLHAAAQGTDATVPAHRPSSHLHLSSAVFRDRGVLCGRTGCVFSPESRTGISFYGNRSFPASAHYPQLKDQCEWNVCVDQGTELKDVLLSPPIHPFCTSVQLCEYNTETMPATPGKVLSDSLLP